MEIVTLRQGSRKRIALALGYFDSLHVGHQHVLNVAKDFAEAHSCETAMFTFDNNPYPYFASPRKPVLTFSERMEKAGRLGVSLTVSAHFDESFAAMDKSEFLSELTENFRIAAIFCGSDYTFGKNAEGDVAYLKAWAERRNIAFFQVDFLERNGEKVSTRQIERFLASGDVREAGEMLGEAYEISGVVETGYRVGRTLGFPTANIRYPEEKTTLKDGVYESLCFADGEWYRGITNVGARPTFGDGERKVETWLSGYRGDLYGGALRVRFVRFMRENRRFSSAEELRAQLELDRAEIEQDKT